MTTPRYAAIYARVSTEDQGKGLSIPTQIEACRIFAKEQGYTVPNTHIFLDEGTSGAILDRAALRTPREPLQTQAIAAVIVYDLDRLSRTMGHQYLLEMELEAAGVRVLVVIDPIEPGPEGSFRKHIKQALAEYERAKLRERTQRGRTGRAQAGHVWGGQVPLGYRAIREPHKARWEIDEAEAVIVRRIFAMCLAGMSTYMITRQLSDERIPTRGNGRRVVQPGVWRVSSVHRILSNEAYTGQTYFNKYVRTGKTTRRLRPREEWQAIAVPAIIDAATFDTAQRQLDRNREVSPRNQKRVYLLSGRRLLCGRCGRVMVGGAYPSAHGMTRRYRCSSLSHIMDPDGRCYGQLKADDVEP